MSWQCGHGGPGVCLACDSKRLDDLLAQAKAEGAAEEREACAKLADFEETCWDAKSCNSAITASRRLAQRIRARGGHHCDATVAMKVEQARAEGAAEEREACAAVCDLYADGAVGSMEWAGRRLAERIRARGGKP